MIDYYFGSGSPPSWRVHLTLEHKALPYRPHLLSFQKGETKSPEFLAVNPRGKVPAIVDDGFALWESAAIVEYLDAKYPDKPLFPRDAKRAAIVRRMIQEADHYLYPSSNRVFRQTFRPAGEIDEKEIEEGTKLTVAELARLESNLSSEYFAGELSAADFTLYPMLAIVRRMNERNPKYAIAIPEKLQAFMKRIESLPFYDKTYPPHWRG